MSANPLPALPVYDSARRPHPFVEEWLEVYRRRELVLQWSVRTIKIRYKRSVLGVIWALLEPLMMMLILTAVFSEVFRFDLPRYPIYILAGLIFFDFFRRSTVIMVDEIIASQNLARRIYIPRTAFALAAILTFGINWLLALIPLLAIMLLLGHPFSWSLLSVAPAMVLTALFALGIGLIVSTLSAFFIDASLTYQVLLTAWMYATPIIYPLAIVPERFRPLLLANPLTHLVRLCQEPIYYGRLADAGTWAVGAAASLVALAAGWWSITHWRDAFDYRA